MLDNLDSATVAQLLDVDERSLRNYVARGMPSQKSGRSRVFSGPEVVAWFVDYKTGQAFSEAGLGEDEGDGKPAGKKDMRNILLRKTTAEAETKELNLSVKRREVITIADAKVALDRLFGNLRTKLLGVAPGLATRMEAETTLPGRQALIQHEMEALCADIATGTIIDAPALGEQPEDADDAADE